MTDKVTVSVIIPVYNTEEYVERCLRSVLNNTYKNIEIICINDGSTDNSLEVIQKVAADDSRVRVINQTNKGVSAARNAGLAECEGEFVAFIDSDDWIHPQYFELLLKCQQENDANLVACGYVKTKQVADFSELSYDKLNIRNADVTQVMNENQLRYVVWARLYKRKLLFGHKFAEDFKRGEDTIFNTEVICSADDLNMFVIDEGLYYYFDRDGSAMYTVSHNEVLRVCEHYIDRLNMIKNPTSQKLYLEKTITSVFSHRYSEMFEENYYETKKKCRFLIKVCLKKMNELNNFSVIEKIQYRSFAKIPILYRLFRIVTDPTMLQWEKSEKQKRKEKLKK